MRPQLPQSPFRHVRALFIAWSLFSSIGLAQESEEALTEVDNSVFYEKILPIFQTHCLECHGADEQESQLRLDSRRSLLQGGDSGEPAVVPGKPEQSFLLHVITVEDEDLSMPPDGGRLTLEQQTLIRKWIESGAAMPQLVDDPIKGANHWSFQPVTRPKVSKVDGITLHPIDALISRKLEQNDLTLSPRADRRTRIRRLYLVMHGLPPMP